MKKKWYDGLFEPNTGLMTDKGSVVVMFVVYILGMIVGFMFN